MRGQRWERYSREGVLAVLGLSLNLPRLLADGLVQEVGEELPIDVGNGSTACTESVGIVILLDDNPLRVQGTSLDISWNMN
jgi:hypothetical protein